MSVEKLADFVVWQEARQLVLRVFAISKDDPEEEKYSLVSQMRRAEGLFQALYQAFPGDLSTCQV